MTLRTALFAATVLGLGAMSGLSVSASAATMNTANPAISGANSGDAAVTKVDSADGIRKGMAIGSACAVASIAISMAATTMQRHGGRSVCRWRQVLSSACRPHGPPHGSAIANANMGTSIARAVVIIAAVVGLSAADVQRT